MFFAAGIATFAYTKMGRRIGYGNSGSVWMIVGVTFILTFLFFLTLLSYVLHFGQ